MQSDKYGWHLKSRVGSSTKAEEAKRNAICIYGKKQFFHHVFSSYIDCFTPGSSFQEHCEAFVSYQMP